MTTQVNALPIRKAISEKLSKPAIRKALLTGSLVGLDLLAILAGFYVAYFIRFEMGITWFVQHEFAPLNFYQQFVFFMTPIFIVVFAIFGLYDTKNLFSGTKEYGLIFNATTLGIMLVIMFTFFDPEFVVARGWVVLSWIILSVMAGGGRFAFRRVVHHMRAQGQIMSRVLIIGANEEGQAIAQQFQSNPKAGVKVIGFVDNELKEDIEPHTEIPVVGNVDSIVRAVDVNHVDEVIIASTALSRRQLLALVQVLHSANISARLSSGLYEILTTGLEVHNAGNVPLLSVNKLRLTGSDVFLKRVLDLAGAIGALLVFMPFMVIISILIKMDSPGPVFYRRRVVGVGGKEFDAFKFRTMCTDADAQLVTNASLRQQFEQNYKLKDDPRVTNIGRFLRKTSLDELPQLINVALGQMSLVGPRMITSPERSYYGKWSMNLFTVKPGITGLWQVSGRSEVSYSERVRLDMQYIRNYSIWMDLYLLWLTIPAVLKRRGAY